MSTKSLLALWVAIVGVLGGAMARAESPADPRTTGHVLVLDNERTLEGDVEGFGDQFCVRRKVGETWVQGTKVLRLCKDLPEAYTFLRDRANLQDPDERIRLARWCLAHGLRTEALADATAAVALRPGHAESQRLVRSLQQALAATSAPAPEYAREDSEASALAASPPDFNPATLGTFITRVQPILMNTCASCHATGHGGAFKLTHAVQDGMINRRATQQNLVAVLAQVSRDRPLASPLLTRAVAVHGDAVQPPLKNRETPAYHTLEEWVKLAVPEGGSMTALPASESRGFAESTPPRAESAPMPRPVTPLVPSPGNPPEPPAAVASPPSPRKPPEAAPVPAGAVSAEPVDPFDPVIFNRQMHPQK